MVEELKANRLDGIGEYYFSQKLREIDQLNQKGFNVLNLGIGSPDLDPPKSVKEALVNSLNDPNFHRYQSYKGIPELRKAFANWYHQHYEVSLDADHEILPLIGSKEGIMHVSMSLLNEDDEVLIPDPGYPTYASASRLAGGIPRTYDLLEENDYWPDFDSLEKQDLSSVKLMWINYPHMPTGTPASKKLYKKLIDFTRRNQIILANDNPYSFTMTKHPMSLLKHRAKNDWVLELNSLSKSHNMAGWRVGALSGNPDLIMQALTFKSNMDSGMFKPVMLAAVEALKIDSHWYDQLNQAYSKRKTLIHRIADELGCTFRQNEVGMFVWCRIPNEQKDGELFSDLLLDKYRIFVPPGMIFGKNGDQYIRFSLCSNEKTLTEVFDRINNES